MRQVQRDAGKCLQLDFYPSLLLSGVNVGRFFRLSTGLDRITVSIIPDYRGNLRVSGLMFLSGKAVGHNHVSARVSALT